MKLNVKALALTASILWGAAVFLAGIANFIWPGYAATFLQLIASIYPGYNATSSFGSVIIGTLYALLDGAIGGLVFAWLYNVFASR
jgi:hypothetical protein